MIKKSLLAIGLLGAANPDLSKALAEMPPVQEFGGNSKREAKLKKKAEREAKRRAKRLAKLNTRK